PAPFGVLLRPPVLSPGPQRRPAVRRQRRGPHEGRFWLVDGLIDALVAQLHAGVVREPGTQVSTDLLRAPSLAQQFTDHPAQFGVGLDAPTMVTAAARGRGTVRLER